MERSEDLIVAIGDSITYGYPYTPDDSWVSLVSQRININIVNQGVCGDTTLGMLIRFKREVISLLPKQVVILGGTNDAFENVDTEEAVSNIKYMVDEAKTHGIKPILGLPLACNYEYEERWLEKFRVFIVQYAKTHDIQIINFYQELKSPSGKGLRSDLHIDGIHPNKKGYQLMAEAVKSCF